MKWIIAALVLLILALGLTLVVKPTISDFETGSLATGTFQPQTSFAEGAPVSARVKIRSNSTRVTKPQLALGVPPIGPFTPAVEMTATSGGFYEATLPQQPYGAHQLQMTVSFVSLTGLERAISSGERPAGGSETRTRAFFVEAAPACFAFDTAPNPDGWTFEGVFDGDTATHVETCPAPALSTLFLWQAGITFPALGAVAPDDGHGAIQFGAGIACYPTTAPSGFWRVDLISPNLEARADWQGLTGFTSRVLSRNLITQLSAQAIITVRDTQGQIRFFRPVTGAASTPVFTSLAPNVWTDVTFANATLPAGSTVQNVRVRVFGVPSTLGPEPLNTLVDGVCPIR